MTGPPPVGAVWDGNRWVPPRRTSGCWAWGLLIVLVLGIVTTVAMAGLMAWLR